MTNPAKLHATPPFLTRRRVIIACTHCRKRKIRCLTAEDPPLHPCDRCTAKGRKCEYITITNQKAGSRKNSPPDDEPRNRASTSSPPVTSLQMHVAPPSPKHDIHVHPMIYSSNSPPIDVYGPLFGAHDRPLPLPHTNPPATYGSRDYHRPYSSTMQPRAHPYLYPAKDFFTGYGTDSPPVYAWDRLGELHTASLAGQGALICGFQT
ncbi:hypothetical protein B0H19DRAFT_1079308 [Mycena capillaripes]|nr:hypothetical protein B0H19DRAFT_1079308 [Mycena capillaripes]